MHRVMRGAGSFPRWCRFVYNCFAANIEVNNTSHNGNR